MNEVRQLRWGALPVLLLLLGSGQGCGGDSTAEVQVIHGRRLYETSCGSCHQLGGEGKYGVASPLAESSWVVESVERLVRIALHGVRGPIEVKGKWYNLEMPGFDRAYDDTQIAAILTYIRQAWGNSASAVSPETVAAIRVKEKERGDSWTAEELLVLD